MNGDQNQQTPPSARQYAPGDNPPSLNEPSKLDAPSLPSVKQQAVPILPEPQAAAKPAPAAGQAPAAPAAAGAASAPAGPGGGFYHPDNAKPAQFAGTELAASGPQPAGVAPAGEVVSWTSSGDALRATAASWRGKMMVVSLIAGGLVYLVTRDFINAGAVLVAGLLFGFMGARKTHGLAYQLDPKGITVGQKRYGYGEFRAFSVADEIRSPSIDLVPLKRFLPVLSLHFDHAQRDRIVEVLATHLPMEAHKRDAFDKLSSKIRF